MKLMKFQSVKTRESKKFLAWGNTKGCPLPFVQLQATQRADFSQDLLHLVLRIMTRWYEASCLFCR
jgi:hypothetical protein